MNWRTPQHHDPGIPAECLTEAPTSELEQPLEAPQVEAWAKMS